MRRSAANSTNRGQQSIDIRPRRFISEAVEAPFKSRSLEKADGPPNASKMSETVLLAPSMCCAYTIRVDDVNITCVNTICDRRPMETMGERLRKARERAGFQSAMAAAKRFGWPTSTYGAHENGQNGFPVDAAERYSRAYKVSAGWLLSGEGDPTKTNVVRVEGLISAGGRIETGGGQDGSGDELDEIEVPFPLPGDAAAFEVAGDSMFPRYDSGDIIVVTKRPQDPRELLNFESVVTTSDGNRYLKRIVPGARKGSFDLESFNAAPMRNVKVKSATEIHLVVRRGQWRRLDNAGKKRALLRQTRGEKT